MNERIRQSFDRVRKTVEANPRTIKIIGASGLAATVIVGATAEVMRRRNKRLKSEGQTVGDSELTVTIERPDGSSYETDVRVIDDQAADE